MEKSAFKALSRLQEMLTSSEVVAPVFVRFITSRGSQMMGVKKVEIDGMDIAITVSGRPSPLRVYSSDVVEVVAFKDGSGAPVFLHDFNAEEYVVAENSAAADWREYVEAPLAAREHCRVQQVMYDVAVGIVDREVVPGENVIPCRPIVEPEPMAIESEILEFLRGAA